jgi:hypothetical protein
MKSNVLITCIAIIVSLSLGACKKESTPPPKDYSASFKNMVWTGEFHYTGKPVQPMSIEFKDGGQFIWYELIGDYAGTWKVENTTLTVTFPSRSGFTATITDDNQLSNIQNASGNGWAVDNANLNSTADIVLDNLDNTVWNGPGFVFRFKPGAEIDLVIGNLTFVNVPYIRKAKSIRFGAYSRSWFAVATAPTIMKCAVWNVFDASILVYQVLKQ